MRNSVSSSTSWLMWAYTFNLNYFIPLITVVFLPCCVNVNNLKERWIRIVSFIPFVALLLLSLLLEFTCSTKSWFYSEPAWTKQSLAIKWSSECSGLPRRISALFVTVHLLSVMISCHQVSTLQRRDMEDLSLIHRLKM